ncbi:MAG: hypothetical protein H6706_18785 [Myxococcales bacterium]|nr:hypothetical protein [Myxococcales bacterium]
MKSREIIVPRLDPAGLVGVATGARLVGVVGFSRPLPAERVAAVEAALATSLDEALARGPSWLVSGATATGVPGLAHAVATRRGVPSVGFTARAALAWPLAPLDWLVIVGEAFGDESAAFVQVCDALVVVGGGPQSAREVAAARARGTPILAWQGLGGVADDLEAGPGVDVRALRG